MKVDLSVVSVSLTPATPDWLPDILKPTQLALMCSPSSPLISKTQEKTPMTVREGYVTFTHIEAERERQLLYIVKMELFT